MSDLTPVDPEAPLDPQDAKIVVLARASRAREGAAEGAAVRDETGRTYAATTVALESLSLTAVQLAVAMAVSSGAKTLAAAALVTDASAAAPEDLAALRDLAGPGIPLYLAGRSGEVHSAVTT